MEKVVIIMGSKGDLVHCKKIENTLRKFEVECVMRVASAHKVPLNALAILKKHDSDNAVFITVAGRSNALSGFTDANTTKPVIACPPYSDKFAGADIFSSLRMPSGVCPLFILEPEQAAIAAVKILALSNPALNGKIKIFQENLKKDLEKDDQELMCNG